MSLRIPNGIQLHEENFARWTKLGLLEAPSRRSETLDFNEISIDIVELELTQNLDFLPLQYPPYTKQRKLQGRFLKISF